MTCWPNQRLWRLGRRSSGRGIFRREHFLSELSDPLGGLPFGAHLRLPQLIWLSLRRRPRRPLEVLDLAEKQRRRTTVLVVRLFRGFRDLDHRHRNTSSQVEIGRVSRGPHLIQRQQVDERLSLLLARRAVVVVADEQFRNACRNRGMLEDTSAGSAGTSDYRRSRNPRRHQDRWDAYAEPIELERFARLRIRWL